MRLHHTIFITLLALSYENRSVNASLELHKVLPLTDDDVSHLQKLFVESNEYDFWNTPSDIHQPVIIMISSRSRGFFSRYLLERNMTSTIIVSDVVKSIEMEEFQASEDKIDQESRQRYERSVVSDLRMGDHYSYNQILDWMDYLENKFHSIVRIVTIGHTHENRVIRGVKIGSRRDSCSRVIWIDGGTHAREWASIHTALFLINELAKGYYNDNKIRKYVDTQDIYIFPCLNPDGYEYTRTYAQNSRRRFWRKNRSPQRCGTYWGERVCCKGVDLNRNYDFFFSGIGTSSSPCSELYHGTRAFAELETIAVRNKVFALQERMDAFINLHAYSQLWLYPYSNKAESYPHDVDDLVAVAKNATISMRRLYGTTYQYGSSAEVLYAFSGGSIDWVKRSTPVKYTYTIELRPSSEASNGFILNREQLIPAAREAFEGIKVVLDAVMKEQNLRRREKPAVYTRCN